MSASPIADTFGEALVGAMLSPVLYGIAIVQMYVYFSNSSGDGWPLKTLVIVAFLLDSAHLATLTHAIWYYLIDSFGLQDNLKVVTGSFLAQLMITSLVATIVQLFYAWHVRHYSFGGVVAAIISTTAIVQPAFSIWFIVSMVQAGSTFDAFPSQSWKMTTAVSISVLSDTVIAVAMFYHLYSTKGTRSDTVVTKIVLYTVTTNVLTAMFSLCSAVLYQTSASLFSDLLYFCVSKLYINSLLAVLNARTSPASGASSTQATSIALSDINRTVVGPRGEVMPQFSAGSKTGKVHVTVSREVDHYGEPGSYKS